MKNPIIRAKLPDFGPIDAVQLRIAQIDAEMERQRQEKVDQYCRRIIEYCDRSITKNR